MAVSEYDEHVGYTPPRALKAIYSEAIFWAKWLGAFCASDLAEHMGVHRRTAKSAVSAMLEHGVLQPVDFEIDAGYGLEQLVRYRTFQWPPDPKEHPTRKPEWQTCEMEILSPRGLPIRMMDDNRRRMSLPGERHRMKLREKRWKEMMDARERAYEVHLARAQKQPKWQRRK